MPKGLSTPGMSTPVRQETEDAETRVLASVADALEAHNKSAVKRKSGAGSTPSDGECRHGEKYALFMEVERDVGVGRPVADRALPSYAWNEELIRDHMDRAIEDISDIAVLSPTACLIFRGRRSAKEGFSTEELQQIIERINGQYIWAGKNALVVGVAVMLAESRHILAKARHFIRTQKLQKLATPSTSLTPRDVRPSLIDALPQGRGKGWRADKHFTKMVAANNLKNLQHKGNEWMQCLLHAATGPLSMTSDAKSREEPYKSAMDYGATTDASLYEAYNSEEESDDVMAYDTETSHLTTVADRNCQWKKQQQRWDRHEKKKQRECRVRKATLPLFKNSTKEGATTYIDWRNSVDELVQDKVGVERIKSLVLQSLEGPPKDMARLANKRGKGTLANILLVLDKVYGRSVSYIHLQLELCNIQQMYKESAQTTLNEWCGSR